VKLQRQLLRQGKVAITSNGKTRETIMKIVDAS